MSLNLKTVGFVVAVVSHLAHETASFLSFKHLNLDYWNSGVSIPKLHSWRIHAAAPPTETARILWERVLDNAEDALGELTRPLKQKKASVPRVVVLGYGWGGHAISKFVDTDEVDLTFVSPRNYFLFTPMLASSSVGTVEYRSITEPARRANPIPKYLEATCLDVWPNRKEILIESDVGPSGTQKQATLSYDYLVWAVGVKIGTFGTPGADKHCIFLKEIEDARRIRAAIINCFEQASLPNTTAQEVERLLSFVVVGGGPSGIEFAGELSDFLIKDLPNFYPQLVGKATVTIVEAADGILKMFDEELQQQAIETLTVNPFVKILLETKVSEVRQKEIVLNGETLLPYGLAVWAAGTEAREITRKLISKIDEQANSPEGKRGFLGVDNWLRVKGTNGTILAIGDAARLTDGPLPTTGQVAAQQGAYLARRLNRGYDLACTVPTVQRKLFTDVSRPFEFLNLGVLAYVGDRKALAQVSLGDTKVVLASGRAGFWLWRSVYLAKQVSLRNHVLVIFDRIKSGLFGRDISRM